MPVELLLERMTWPEIAEAINSGLTTAIVVAASSEQHGPHLPEATDALLGEALAVRLAERLGDALVAPVIRPGCSEHHMGFPGTISISADTLMTLLDDYVTALKKHGFTRLIVFSSHGGNFPVLARWAEERAQPGVVVLSNLSAFAGAMLGALRQFGRDDTTILHADASETAEMMFIHPELVRESLAERGFVGEVSLADLQSRGLRAISANGVLGDP